MKALSIRQPWAWLILHGKDIENRKWNTHYRGPILIHAAKGMTFGEYQMTKHFAEQRGVLLPPKAQLELGGIIGMADIVDCVTHHSSHWFEGPRGLVLTNQRPLPFTPCAGALGLFEVPFNIEERIIDTTGAHSNRL